MSGRTFASRSLASMPGQTGPSVPNFRRRGAEVEMLLHLALVGVVGAIIIAIFFVAGIYSLQHPHDGSPAPSNEKLASAAAAPPSGAAVPAVITASVGVLAPSTPDPAQRDQASMSSSQTPQPDAPTNTPGMPSGPKPPSAASAEQVSGSVAEAFDAMTWVIDDRIVHLWGIRPAPRAELSSLNRLVDWVRAKGSVECRRQAHSSRYRCVTATREDIAEAALLTGIGRAANGATARYRSAEAQAHRQQKGM